MGDAPLSLEVVLVLKDALVLEDVLFLTMFFEDVEHVTDIILISANIFS